MLKQVLELKAGDLLRDAIHLLYEKNVSVALITDSPSTNYNTDNAASSKLSDRYIGVISFPSMVLWCIEVPYTTCHVCRRQESQETRLTWMSTTLFGKHVTLVFDLSEFNHYASIGIKRPILN